MSKSVKIEKIKETKGITSTKNPHSVSNVNQAMGPRTGNTGAHAGKRGAFTDAKAERAPLATTILKAYGARAQKDAVDSKLEPVSANTKAKFAK